MDDILDINTLFGPLPIASTDLTVVSLVALMQKHNVGGACTLSTLGLLLDPAVGNTATRAACSEYAQLVPIATWNPTMYFGDTAPLLSLKADGFCLLRFFPAAQGWSPDFAPFRSLLRCLDETGLPIMVDIQQPGEITALTRVLDAYPAPIILSAVDMATLAEAVAALRQHTHWHLEISRLLAPGSIRLVADSVGAARLLFGTGAPFHPIASALHVLEHAGLPADARSQILAANARRILHLGH